MAVVPWLADKLFNDGKASDAVVDTVEGLWNDYTGQSIAEENIAASQAAQQQAQQFQIEQQKKAQELAQPFIDSSKTGLDQLMVELGLSEGESGFQMTPQYQSALDKGIETAQGGAASSGMLFSGEHLKDLQSTGQSIQNQSYNDYLNKLMGVSSPQTALTIGAGGMGMGQNLAAQLMASQNAQNQYATQGAEGERAAVNDIIGGIGAIYGSGV